jgi:YidC/Oxa1 family membrane protein insertase
VIVLGFGDILQPLEDSMKWLLERFHENIGLPWAWSIVATTIVVRILLVPLTVRQIHSMQSLQKHAPEMKEIQRKYKGDRQKLNEELMKFYKENKINPAASCLPLLAQLPVFLALFFVLRDFADEPPCSLKPAKLCVDRGDFAWLNIVPNIADKASDHWSGFLLLVIYAASQVLSTYFMSATMDKTQRTIMMIVPLLFITVIANFPAGLVLYWVTTNLWTVGQGLITRHLMPKTPMPSWGKRPTKKAPGEKTAAPKKEPSRPKPAPVAQKPQPRRVKRNKKGGARN